MPTYFVKSSGGSGSGLDNANAWSYSKYNSMASTLLTGDIVKFNRGDTYAGPMALHSGVSYQDYGTGANPVISGLVAITGWVQYSGNIYYFNTSSLSPAPPTVRIVTVDNVLRGYGRFPNTGYLTFTSHSAPNSITGATISTLPSGLTGGGEVVIKKQRYIIDRHKITGQTSSTLTFLRDNFYGDNTTYLPDDNNGYFIQNHISTLDQDGDWCFDESTSRIYMYFGNGNPSGRVVKISAYTVIAYTGGLSNVTFSNITFEGGDSGVINESGTNIIFNNCTFRQQAFGVYGNSCTNMQINGGSISECSCEGVFVDANGVNTLVEGVTVNKCGWIAGLGKSGDSMYNAINVVGTGTIIRSNIVTNTGFNGIYTEGENFLVEKNRVDTFCVHKDDGAGIYTFCLTGVNFTGRIIRNNIVTNCVGSPEGAGADGDFFGKGAAIYLDGFTNHLTVTNNICFHGVWAGIYINGNSNNTITNNLVYDFKFALQIYVTTTAVGDKGTVRSNIITGNKFIAKTSTQQTLAVWLFVNDNPSLFGTFDNNYYARPLSEGASIDVHYRFAGQDLANLKTLGAWKSTYNQDINSSASKATVSSEADIRDDFNFSASPITVSLQGNYKDVDNSSFAGSRLIPAFGGAVSLYQSPIISTGHGRVIVFLGKVIVDAGKVLKD